MTRLGVGERLGGDTAGTADPEWLKGYSIPPNVTLSRKNWGRDKRRGGWLPRWLLFGGWLGMGLPVGDGEWISFAYFFLFLFFPSPVKTVFVLTYKFSGSCSSCFPSLYHWGDGEWASDWMGAWLLIQLLTKIRYPDF